MAVNLHSDMSESHKGDTKPPNTLDTITLKNQEDSPLLRLPAELKKEIYAYVSEHTTAKEICHKRPYDKVRFKHDISGLLLACRQLHFEAKPYVKTHQYMTWCGYLRELRLPTWIVNIKRTQITEIVVPASQNWERDHELGVLGCVLSRWSSLRYIEIHRRFSGTGQEKAMDRLENDLARMQTNLCPMPVRYTRSILTLADFRYLLAQETFEVCIKCKEGKASWMYKGEDHGFISSWEPYNTV